MKYKALITIAILTSIAEIDGINYCQANDSIVQKQLSEAICERYVNINRIAGNIFDNPAINQWRYRTSVTTVGVGFEKTDKSDATDIRLGKGGYDIKAGAETYTRYKSFTLWGRAQYSNGKIRDIKWNETADAELLYPYLLADSVGGDMNNEVYRFEGGYSDHKGRLAWGGKMSYTALLQYRTVDPRPRNVSGTLDISAGIAGRVWRDYMVGGALYFRKYKQTNEVMFKSEMGVDKIYHLTGMGNHYTRWAGTGLSTYYDGYSYGVSADVYPQSGTGPYMNAKMSRFTFTNIISDLNKLPMAHLWHNQLDLSAGWLSTAGKDNWGVGAEMTLYRRHGIENIFGDAASSVYPLIGSNAMYADNYITLSVCGGWVHKYGNRGSLGITLKPEWMHDTEAYIEPYSYKVINHAGVSVKGEGIINITKKWMLAGTVDMKIYAPYHNTLHLNNGSTVQGLVDVEKSKYLAETNLRESICAGATLVYLITPRRGLSLNFEWEGVHIKGVSRSNCYVINLNFLFI